MGPVRLETGLGLRTPGPGWLELRTSGRVWFTGLALRTPGPVRLETVLGLSPPFMSEPAGGAEESLVMSANWQLEVGGGWWCDSYSGSTASTLMGMVLALMRSLWGRAEGPRSGTLWVATMTLGWSDEEEEEGGGGSNGAPLGTCCSSSPSEDLPMALSSELLGELLDDLASWRKVEEGCWG